MAILQEVGYLVVLIYGHVQSRVPHHKMLVVPGRKIWLAGGVLTKTPAIAIS